MKQLLLVLCLIWIGCSWLPPAALAQSERANPRSTHAENDLDDFDEEVRPPKPEKPSKPEKPATPEKPDQPNKPNHKDKTQRRNRALQSFAQDVATDVASDLLLELFVRAITSDSSTKAPPQQRSNGMSPKGRQATADGGLSYYGGVNLLSKNPTSSDLAKDPGLKAEGGRLDYGGVLLLPSIQHSSLGLIFERGHLQEEVQEQNGNLLYLTDYYSGLGVVFTFIHPRSRWYSQVALLGGQLDNSPNYSMGIARYQFSYRFSTGLTLGFLAGSHYLELDPSQNQKRRGSPFQNLSGMEMGMDF